jgi:hypothetical protein
MEHDASLLCSKSPPMVTIQSQLHPVDVILSYYVMLNNKTHTF